MASSGAGFTINRNIKPIVSDKKPICVLVINSCQKMAKEITLELTQTFPGAEITYSPTFSLAKLLLSKHNYNLVVSSSRLIDGKIQTLQTCLNSKSNPPPLVIIGNAQSTQREMLGIQGYLFSSLKKLENSQTRINPKSSLSIKPEIQTKDKIQDLGADLRNDLNNPLQEIVAMVYVAKSQTNSADLSNQALEAISKAAMNLSAVVKGIENKIRLAVGSE